MRRRRVIEFNLLTGVVLGVVGFYVGWWLGHLVKAPSLDYFGDTGQNDIALFVAYFTGVVGFLVGLGFANYPIQRMLGKPPSLREKETEGIGRYFGLCTDHKVVGIQYLIGIGAFIFIGGLNAMLMIGARRMAFPRIEALTFWLLMAAGTILMTALAFGGFPTGWTGYAPLSEQANMGMDAYIAFFALVGLSMTLLGINMLATVITMRAPGLAWSRLPIFVWGTVSTSVLMVLAAPVLISTLFMLALDRTAQTGFFNDQAGGSPYLYENLFWIFGHPEVYILALPGMGIVLELLPVFARKPLWGYRLAVTGLLGITLLSFLVWQHHLFVSGINADLRPFYMLSTELISLPTGFIFVCALGTLWAGRIRLTVPMLFALAWVFNFLVGGLSGVFLSDVPSDVTTHGSFFSMAHFHYTIMGGLVFAFFGAVYYWLPKMTGFELDERLGKVHFWVMFVAFNSTFGPLLVIGFLGMPRRVVTYAGYLQGANAWVSVSAFVLGASMLVFVANLVWSQVFARVPATANPWGSKSIEFQLPSPVPVHDFDRIPTFGPDPYPYGGIEDAGFDGTRPAVSPARPTA
jgi:cytochrome c oxidase subunit 1